jgi:hypothetical protein
LNTVTARGTYTIGNDCSIRLTFMEDTSSGGTGATSRPPVAFRGLLVSRNGGVLSIQPESSQTSVITGTFITQ